LHGHALVFPVIEIFGRITRYATGTGPVFTVPIKCFYRGPVNDVAAMAIDVDAVISKPYGPGFEAGKIGRLRPCGQPEQAGKSACINEAVKTAYAFHIVPPDIFRRFWYE
jgi:hypothetical protein